MENCSLFVHMDGECTYYDYFSNIVLCLKEAGYNLKRDKDRLEQVAVMLTLASAMIGGRPVPEYNKYIEMIRFAQNYLDADGLDNLIEIFDGSYVSSGVMLLDNEFITPDEFDIYEKVVDIFYLRSLSGVSKVKFRTINAKYIAAKNVMKKSFDFKEKATEEGKNKADEKAEREKDKAHALDSPYKLAKYLKQFVIGQDFAVDIFANTAFQYNRYTKADKKPPKHYNVLIIGPSGSGKTTLMRAFDTLSRVYMVDCAGVTESGYKGIDAKDIVKNSKYGNVVFYDEFDKLLVPSINGAGIDTHKEVQSCFYKMMEESLCLNIFAGAFEGIDEIVRKRLKSKKTVVGFSNEALDYDDVDIYDVTEEDILAFGATREFTGRVDVIIRLRNLEEEDYVKILKDSEYSPVKSEIAVARDCYGIELELSDDFYLELAAMASSQEVGARALKQHINRVIDPILAQGMDRNCSKVIVDSLDDEPHYITKKKTKGVL